MRHAMSQRPPFENRWTSGKKAWRWHQELEALGVENTRMRLALQDSHEPVGVPDPEMPTGFVRDWLRNHDREVRHGTARWRTVMAILVGLTLIIATVSIWLALAR